MSAVRLMYLYGFLMSHLLLSFGSNLKNASYVVDLYSFKEETETIYHVCADIQFSSTVRVIYAFTEFYKTDQPE